MTGKQNQTLIYHVCRVFSKIKPKNICLDIGLPVVIWAVTRLHQEYLRTVGLVWALIGGLHQQQRSENRSIGRSAENLNLGARIN